MITSGEVLSSTVGSWISLLVMLTTTDGDDSVLLFALGYQPAGGWYSAVWAMNPPSTAYSWYQQILLLQKLDAGPGPLNP